MAGSCALRSCAGAGLLAGLSSYAGLKENSDIIQSVA
jgi:hypothetical protein